PVPLGPPSTILCLYTTLFRSNSINNNQRVSCTRKRRYTPQLNGSTRIGIIPLWTSNVQTRNLTLNQIHRRTRTSGVEVLSPYSRDRRCYLTSFLCTVTDNNHLINHLTVVRHRYIDCGLTTDCYFLLRKANKRKNEYVSSTRFERIYSLCICYSTTVSTFYTHGYTR